MADQLLGMAAPAPAPVRLSPLAAGIFAMDPETGRPLILPRHITARPSQAQLDAGNYAKPRLTFQGLPISIENPRGSIRSGRSKGGKEWSVSMHHHYGYIRGTRGADGDHYDCYVGPNEAATHAFIVTTMCPPDFTRPDEQKAMLGFDSAEAARAAYLLHYDDPRFCGDVRTMPMAEFKAKVMATSDGNGMVKALVHGHQRRLPSGRVLFIAPYATRTPSADQAGPDLFSYRPVQGPPPNPKRHGLLHLDASLERAVPGIGAAAREMVGRLLPGYRVDIVAVRDPKMPTGLVNSPHSPLSYGREDPVLPKAGATDFRITLNLRPSGDTDRPREDVLHTLLHEVGHAFMMARVYTAPKEVQDAIRAQWQAEIVQGAKGHPRPASATDFADQVTMSTWLRRGVAPEDKLRLHGLRQLQAGSGQYYRSWDEWFAERFASWVRDEAPDSAITRFFRDALDALKDAWSRALEILGMKPPPMDAPLARFATATWRERDDKPSADLIVKANPTVLFRVPPPQG